MKLKIFFVACCASLSLSTLSTAQNLGRARQIIDTLCSPEMHGRGYSFSGSDKAAAWIGEQYQKMGLKAFQGGYYQSFPLQAVIFEGSIELSIDGNSLQPGKDFIAHASSGSGKGRASLFFANTELFENPVAFERNLPENLNKYALVYEQKDEKLLYDLPKYLAFRLFQMPFHIQTAAKLTHRIGNEQYPIPIIIAKDSLIAGNAAKAKFDIEARLGQYEPKNAIAYIEGTEKPDSFFVFTAHYDHLGNMGEEIYFPGANDNASGVAMMLELAQHFANHPLPYSIAFMAFGGEEAGLIGSKYYVEHPLFPLGNIKFLLNIDLMATGEEGTTVVNATEFPEAFEQLKLLNQQNSYLKEIYSRGPAANSDHYFFYKQGVPSFFLYLMGDWPHYHDVQDRPPVPLTEFEDTFRLLRDFVVSRSRI